MDADDAFVGSKLALFIGPKLLVIQRDDFDSIPYPGHWDFPGGGREGDESAIACTLRETREEVGLNLSRSDLAWSRWYWRDSGRAWFFAAHLPGSAIHDVRLGSEGQRWAVWTPEAYIEHPLSIPPFVEQLRDYLELPDTETRLLAS